MVIKAGHNDGRISKLAGVRTCILANFNAMEPHGHSYARVSTAVRLNRRDFFRSVQGM